MFRNGLGLLLASLLILSQVARAQQIRVRADLDSSSIRIGEQTVITIRVETESATSPVQITWPPIADSLVKGIQVVSVAKTDTIHDKTRAGGELVRRVTITSFDTGYYALPPFPIIIAGDTSKPLLTEALLLHVIGLRVDTTLAIRDIKQPLGAPFDWRELIPLLKWVGLGLLVAALGIYLIRRLLRKKRTIKEVPVPVVPEHILALDKLEKLRDEKLWQQGKQKEYHSSLTDIIRMYIWQRFSINAMEQTSEEIISSFRSMPVGQENQDRLKQLLYLSDMIKFAKQHALPAENEMSMANAIAFVTETIPENPVLSHSHNPES